jgi:hypothetical protein
MLLLHGFIFYYYRKIRTAFGVHRLIWEYLQFYGRKSWQGRLLRYQRQVERAKIVTSWHTTGAAWDGQTLRSKQLDPKEQRLST